MPTRRTRISLAEAAAAAERNGIDMRLLQMRYEPGSEAFGQTSYTLSGKLVRTGIGRIRLTPKDPALRSEIDAVRLSRMRSTTYGTSCAAALLGKSELPKPRPWPRPGTSGERGGNWFV